MAKFYKHKRIASSLEPSAEKIQKARSLRDELKKYHHTVTWSPLTRRAELVAPNERQCRMMGVEMHRLPAELRQSWRDLKEVIEFLCERGFMRRNAAALDEQYGGQRVALLDEVLRLFPGSRFVMEV